MKLRKLFSFLLLIGLLSQAHALTRDTEVWWLPLNISRQGQKVDELFHGIFFMTLAVFLITQFLLVYFSARYRHKEGARALYTHGNNRLEFIWTIIPLIIFLCLAFYSNHLWKEWKIRPIPENRIEIDVVAQQFDWQFRYPGLDGQFGATDPKLMAADNVFAMVADDVSGRDDIKVGNEMVVPVGVPVRLHLRSRDVIHAFYVPELRLFQDAVPGKTISWVWFDTFKTGNFQIACSQLCGVNHYKMFARLRVVTQKEFDTWIQQKADEIKATQQEQAAHHLSSTDAPPLAFQQP